MSFVHLHQHTEYSLLDGASKVSKAAQAAARDGQPALAITDHGNLYGLLDFYKACRNEGVKPILGIEAYQARESVADRPKKSKRKNTEDGETERGDKLYHHLTVLAENEVGYQNLIQLSSRSFLEGFYHKPRVDWDILCAHSSGLIVTSGCLGGIVLQELLHDDFEAAKSAASRFKDIYDDRFFIELQDHGIPEQAKTNPELIRISKQLDIPLICTNDSHYVEHADHASHDALLCVQTKSRISDKDRFRFHGDQHYLKTADEMRHLFRDFPEACDNTLLIAERCNVEIEFGRNLLPKFEVPDGFETEEAYLNHLVDEGAKTRWDLTPEIRSRIDYELEVINQMGFPGYFLIVWDLVRHAKATGIRVGPGRGSAGGSAVAYALGITDIDPIKWGLLFERFLNPSRISMPDIDIDFDSRFRDHMINYCVDKYGEGQVAQIITFGQIKSRNAVRDAARVLGQPYAKGDAISKALPPTVFGRDVPLEQAIAEHEPVANLYQMDPDARQILDIAKGLEGLRRQDSVHAAAVVIGPDELTKFVPIQQKPKGPVITQYDMHGVEDLGLLKMDFLGLRNLDVITDCLELIEQRHGIVVDPGTFDLTDVSTYELLSAAKTIGVFQLEGTQMRALLRRLKPERFEDLAAVLALYRPGPMAVNMHNDYADRKNGKQEVSYFHPDAKELLDDTYGLMVYQEQLMAVAQKFAGYSLAEADNLRKACGKKLPEVMEKEREKFESAVVVNGYEPDLAVDLFNMIAGFADYAFNASHAYGYATVSFQTAYLKCHYPTEYFTALLTSVQGEHDRLSVYLAEARREGFDLASPDINLSQRTFYPVDDHTIIFGLLAIRDIGEIPAQLVIQERQSNGPYISFFDFVDRVDKRALNKKVVDALIGSGAFDSMKHPRRGLAMISQEVVKSAVKKKNEDEQGRLTLFDMETDTVKQGVPEIHYASDQLLAMEKEYLGVFLSGHPMADMQDQLEEVIDYTIEELYDLPPEKWGIDVVVAGMITGVRSFNTKKGDPMKTFTLQDMTGQVPCVLFPRQNQDYGSMINVDDIVVVQAKPGDDMEGVKLVIEKVEQHQRAFTYNQNVHVWIPDTYSMDELKRHIGEAEGAGTVVVHFMGDSVALPEAFTASVESVKQVLDNAFS